MMKEKKMKKLFAILAVLSLLMVPCVSMASTMTDSDLADVTGQMGVTILVSNLELGVSLATITWGDLDGFSDASWAGYVNMVIPMAYTNTPFVMHIGVTGLKMDIDVGTYNATNTYVYSGSATLANKSAIKIGINGIAVTIDAIAAFIFVNNAKGADTDYAGDNPTSGTPTNSTPSYNWGAQSAGAYQNAKLYPLLATSKGGTFTDGAAGNSSLATDCLGVIGMSHIRATVNALNLIIMAH
jgi:hypothetical protein